jgi:hypothetical protein
MKCGWTAYHIADFSGATSPGKEDITATTLGELLGGCSRLALFDRAGGSKAGQSKGEESLGVHDADVVSSKYRKRV